jgi:hypothetical protein
MTKIGKISASVALILGLAAPAFAGPRMTFGPNDEGALQIDYKGQLQMTVRDIGSGPNKDDTTMDFNFRRNRLALMGKYGKMLSLYVQTEFTEHQDLQTLSVRDNNEGSNFQLLDAVMRFNLNDAFKVNAGKFKYNLSRENLEACEMPLTLDRSLFIRAPFVTTRDTGVAVWGNLFNNMFQYRVDVMEGRSATTSAAPQPKSNFRYSGRAHVTLLDPEKDYGYKGTYLGKKKVLTVGGAYQYEPELAYSDTVNKTGAKDYKAWTVDGFFEYPVESIGTFTVSGAYEDIDLGDAYKGNNPDPDAIGINGQKNGYYVKGGYMLPKLPLQFFGRYEQWRFANLNSIFDQKVNWYGGGLNYYIRDQNLKLTFEASRTDFDKGAKTAADGTKDFMTFVTQLQVIF